MTRKRALTTEQVIKIRAMYQHKKFGYGAIAKIFEVGESTIRDCIKKYTQYSARI